MYFQWYVMLLKTTNSPYWLSCIFFLLLVMRSWWYIANDCELSLDSFSVVLLEEITVDLDLI